MMESDDDNNPESIAFIGRRDAPPIVNIDFDKPIWQVEFYYPEGPQFYVVNAETKKEAVANALIAAVAAGAPPRISIESVITTELGVKFDEHGTDQNTGPD